MLQKEKEALRTFLKDRAAKHCKEEQRAYYECVQSSGFFSVVWRCRRAAKDMSDCFSQYTSSDEQERLETAWLNQGKPSLRQWRQQEGID